MSFARGKIYQDQLYGAKILSQLAVAIMDTPEFQRLAGLRQLGFTDLVYRGARHNRFAHSVGTHFACRTLLRRIVQNHERMELPHPGTHLGPSFRSVPKNSGHDQDFDSVNSRWRGMSEVVSIAALLHDIGHVPFGHTLEDEFAGLYERHDRLAGARLYQFLYNPKSELAQLFSRKEPWVGTLSNETLRRLIVVILNFKESVASPEPPYGFDQVLKKALDTGNTKQQERVRNLATWHQEFTKGKLYHPFMSDVIGNTICADILDYLPRDREHLGMEPRFHTRLQRFMVIKAGSLYKNEGLRLTIVVTRKGRGGQRRDVATTVLAIMRERYEMAERVLYHHKKASASTLLAKLIEITPPDGRPRDDDELYPAPWNDEWQPGRAPHLVHLSDESMIDYLGQAVVPGNQRLLQRRLYSAIRFKRQALYKTLLVIDTDLAKAGSHDRDYIAAELRGVEGQADRTHARLDLERRLAEAAGSAAGEVLIYCPHSRMQSKEIDARLEIVEGTVQPLSRQTDFVYSADVDVLRRYYDTLWRAYVFVTPELFANPHRCKQVVDFLCDHFALPRIMTYQKVRQHSFEVAEGLDNRLANTFIKAFVQGLPFSLPSEVHLEWLDLVPEDKAFIESAKRNSELDVNRRLSALVQAATLRTFSFPVGSAAKKAKCLKMARTIQDGADAVVRPALGAAHQDFATFAADLVEAIAGKP